jgi:hypothetical protein
LRLNPIEHGDELDPNIKSRSASIRHAVGLTDASDVAAIGFEMR